MEEWIGNPEFCDLCGKKIQKQFIDGKVLVTSSWAIMCPNCHSRYGVGFGTGLGQLYEREGNQWIKIK